MTLRLSLKVKVSQPQHKSHCRRDNSCCRGLCVVGCWVASLRHRLPVVPPSVVTTQNVSRRCPTSPVENHYYGKETKLFSGYFFFVSLCCVLAKLPPSAFITPFPGPMSVGDGGR